MAGGTVGGMVSLATRQTPQIDDNTPARGGIIMYNGVWRVAKLTITPTVPRAIPQTVPPSETQVSETRDNEPPEKVVQKLVRHPYEVVQKLVHHPYYQTNKH